MRADTPDMGLTDAERRMGWVHDDHYCFTERTVRRIVAERVAAGRERAEAANPISNVGLTELLLETDALTPNHDGTPEHYIVDAENVDYLIQTILALGVYAENSPALHEGCHSFAIVEQAAERGRAEARAEFEHRVALAMEATYWDRPYDTRIEAIRDALGDTPRGGTR